MRTLPTFLMTTKLLAVGLAALVLSACVHDHGRYRGGGYYYGDDHKHYDRDERGDEKDRTRDDRARDGKGDRRYSRRYRYRDDDPSYLDRPYDGRYGYSDGRRPKSGKGGKGEKYDGYYGKGGYDRGYRVCDSDGDRCYLSNSPYWDYRQYYRDHGYRWDDE